jgi:outer membrane protein assembly factor BamB
MIRALAATLACAALVTGSAAGTTAPRRSLVIVSASGSIDRSFPDLQLDDAVADGAGGWFVGGFGGLHRLRTDGTIDPAWRAGLPAGARVLIVVRGGGTVVAFESNRRHASELDAVDAATGALRWRVTTNTAYGGQAAVFGLAAAPPTLYVSGAFSRVGGVARNGLAALNIATGRVGPLRPPSPLRNGSLRGYFGPVAVAGARLFVGGSFSTVAGRPRPNLVALRRSDGRLLPWQPGTARGYVKGAGIGDVETLLTTRGVLFGAGHDGFGVVSASTGRILPWMYRITSAAVAFAASGRIVYLGGDLRNSLDGVDFKLRNNLAAIDVATGHATSWAPNVARYVSVRKLAVSKGRVLVIGDFAGTLSN